MLFSPKIIRFFLSLSILLLFSKVLNAQANFLLSSSLCVGDTVKVTATTGTFAATGFFWSSSSSGPVFSSQNLATTEIIFSTAGIYTITLSMTSSSGAYTASIVTTVSAPPTLSLSSSDPSLCAGADATLTVSGALSYVWTPTVGLYFLSNSSAYLSPNATVAYTVVGTSSVGCKGSASITQFVNNYPALVLSATSSVACAGFSATLSANGANSYTWTSNTFTASIYQSTAVAGPGTYSLLGANGDCFDSGFINIGLAPSITLTASASRNTICINDGDAHEPVNLSVSGASQYSWLPFNVGFMTYSLGPTTSVSPSVTTCYTVTGTTNVCEAVEVLCVNVSTCTSLQQQTNNTLSAKIFPNPAVDKLWIECYTSDRFTVKIVSMTGQLMQEEVMETNGIVTPEILIDKLSAGMYLIYLNHENQTTQVLRFIKQ